MNLLYGRTFEKERLRDNPSLKVYSWFLKNRSFKHRYPIPNSLEAHEKVVFTTVCVSQDFLRKIPRCWIGNIKSNHSQLTL